VIDAIVRYVRCCCDGYLLVFCGLAGLHYVVQCVEIEKDDVAGHTLLNKRLTKSV
jgi:hypothetical protein